VKTNEFSRTKFFQKGEKPSLSSIVNKDGKKAELTSMDLVSSLKCTFSDLNPKVFLRSTYYMIEKSVLKLMLVSKTYHIFSYTSKNIR
jgi:hypothetical protein